MRGKACAFPHRCPAPGDADARGPRYGTVMVVLSPLAVMENVPVLLDVYV